MPKNKKQFCIHDHDTFICGRDTQGHCLDCKRLRDRTIIRKRISSAKDKERKKKYYKVNKILILKRIKIYQQKNKENLNFQRRKHAKEHPELIAQRNIKQHERRKLRIPTWGQRGILLFYANCPKGMVVDHIIPLLGKNISGLHVRWNLQYLIKSENEFKRNSWDGTIENNGWRMAYALRKTKIR
jgi:hypothetical protein